MNMRKYLTAKAGRELDEELVSGLLDVDVGSMELDPEGEMFSETLDLAMAHKGSGLKLPPVDPLTGLVLDSTPELVAERSGLEELDVQEIHRHRYDGQYPGKPRSHYLGGSNDITFGGDDSEISDRWERVKDGAVASGSQKAWREAYHQIGFIVDRDHLDLPASVREDVCRAYSNLRGQNVSKGYSLEKLLGLLTYVACRIHGYPREFDDVKDAIGELYDLSISKSNVTRNMVRAFNKGPIRFGIQRQNNREYLTTWKMVSGQRKEYSSLGRL